MAIPRNIAKWNTAARQHNYFRGNFPHGQQVKKSFGGTSYGGRVGMGVGMSTGSQTTLADRLGFDPHAPFAPTNYAEYMAMMEYQRQMQKDYQDQMIELEQQRQAGIISNRNYQLEVDKMNQAMAMFQIGQQNQWNIAQIGEEGAKEREQMETDREMVKQQIMIGAEELAKQKDQIFQLYEKGLTTEADLKKTKYEMGVRGLTQIIGNVTSATGALPPDEDIERIMGIFGIQKQTLNAVGQQYAAGEGMGGGMPTTMGQPTAGGAVMPQRSQMGGGMPTSPYGGQGPTVQPMYATEGGEPITREESPITYEGLLEEGARTLAEKGAGGPIELPRGIGGRAVSAEEVADLMAQYPGREADLAQALGVSPGALKRVGGKAGKKAMTEKISPFVGKPQEGKGKGKGKPPRGTIEIGGETYSYSPKEKKFIRGHVPPEAPEYTFAGELPTNIPPTPKLPSGATGTWEPNAPPLAERLGVATGKGIGQAGTFLGQAAGYSFVPSALYGTPYPYGMMSQLEIDIGKAGKKYLYDPTSLFGKAFYQGLIQGAQGR